MAFLFQKRKRLRKWNIQQNTLWGGSIEQENRAKLPCAVLSRSVVSDSLRPRGLSPARLLCPWGFSRQEYRSGVPCPPPGDLPSPSGLLYCRQILYCLSRLGSSSSRNSCLYCQMRAWSNFRMPGKLIWAQRLAQLLTFGKTERLLLLWRLLRVWSTMFIRLVIAYEVCCKCRLLIFFINNRRRIMALTPKYF